MTPIERKVPSPLEIVLGKLKEQGLPKETLKIHDIWEDNINEMSWETATKLSRFFGIEQAFWMNLAYDYKMNQGGKAK